MHLNEIGINSVSAVIDILPNEEEEFVYWRPLNGENGTWNWNPNWIPSQTHWLRCGVVIPRNALCTECGMRLNE